MALTINNPITLSNKQTTGSFLHQPLCLPCSLSLYSATTSSSRTLIIVAATRKFTSKTGKFDSKNKRNSITTTKDEALAENNLLKNYEDNIIDESFDDGFVLPELPGDKPDFWEGPQWDALGFFVQYMWAFGIVFALIACGIAVATYNEGATDFRKTPAYKESIESRDLLEGPEGSDADVFESNPTEEAPALD
ncbi:13S globulin seed storage protein 3 [Bienertia sinuspersici]